MENLVNGIRRIFLFSDSSLNSSSSSSYSNYTTTTESSLFSSATKNSSTTENNLQPLAPHGIYEDHPGLNPTDERVVELQSNIRVKLEEISGDPERAQIMAERLHGESDNIPFMQSIFENLNTQGAQGEAYIYAVNSLAEIHLNYYILEQWPESSSSAVTGNAMEPAKR